MDERDQDKEDKTEEPTEERRRQFREEGKLANPREVLSALSLIGFAILAYAFGSTLFGGLSQSFVHSWAQIPAALKQSHGLADSFYTAFRPVLPSFLIGAAILLLAPVMSGLAITRFNWSWKKMEFNFEKLNPVNGIKNIFGQNLIVETLKNLAKSILISAAILLFLKDKIFQNISLVNTDISLTFHTIGQTLLILLVMVCIPTIIIGAADYAWSLFKTEQELRMTKQQLKQEIKTHEGDPLIKSQRRRLARDMFFKASVEKVPNATFVVTNPTHYSVAVLYRSGMAAPIVVSKGQDYLALKIREIAKQHDIIMIENKPLARALYKTVDIGDEVPASLYTALIEVMRAIYVQRGRSYFDRFGIGSQFQPSVG